MIMNAACFLLGTIFGTVTVIVIACLSVAGKCDREEEKHRNTK